jgi:hypothetical protein
MRILPRDGGACPEFAESQKVNDGEPFLAQSLTVVKRSCPPFYKLVPVGDVSMVGRGVVGRHLHAQPSELARPQGPLRVGATAF